MFAQYYFFDIDWCAIIAGDALSFYCSTALLREGQRPVPPTIVDGT